MTTPDLGQPGPPADASPGDLPEPAGTVTCPPDGALSPGDVLAGRYRLVGTVSPCTRHGSCALWRALDEVLARPVALKVLALPVQDAPPAAQAFLEAATRAGAVVTPGLTRVYDAAAESRGPVHLAYVVSEWVEGRSVAELLTDGPLPAADAVRLARQATRALSGAHRAGLLHGRVHPGNLLLGHDGRLRLTDAAVSHRVQTLLDPYAAPAATVAGDTRDLAAVLFALLTARWPASTSSQPSAGVPAAPAGPHQNRPHLLRAGVPRSLDALVASALRPDDTTPGPATTDAQVSGAQVSGAQVSGAQVSGAQVSGAQVSGAQAGDVTPPGPPVGPRTPAELDAALARVEAGTTSSVPVPPRVPATARRRRRRLPLLAAAATLLGAGGGLGLLLGGLPDPNDRVRASTLPPSPPAPSAAATPSAPAAALRVQRVVDFDPPPGDGHEAPDAVARVLDADPATSWHTDRYRTARFGGLKSGVGLLLDLGRPVPVTGVTVALTSPGASLELRAGDRPGTRAADYPVVAQAPAPSPATLTLRPSGAPRRYWLLWLTSLPADGGGFREGVRTVTLR